MENKNKQCGGIEDYQWLIVLVIEAVVRVITALLDKDKPKEPDKGPAAATATNNQKEQSDD